MGGNLVESHGLYANRNLIVTNVSMIFFLECGKYTENRKVYSVMEQCSVSSDGNILVGI